MCCKVSIILPTYNRGFIIGDCLKSVITQTYDNWELIIADDGSNDNTEDIIKGLSKNNQKIIYYKNSQNLGLPGNRNKAIKEASGHVVFFIEDDMVLRADCLENLVKTYELLSKQGEKIGAICPSLITQISYNTSQRGVLNHVRDSRNDDLEKSPCIIDKKTGLIYRNFSPKFNGIIIVEDCHSCSLYPKEIFEKIQYPENIYTGNYIGEESEMNIRLRKMGYNLYFQPKAVMNHFVQENGGCRLPLYKWSYYFIRNHSLFLARNYSYKFVYMESFFLFYILRTVVSFSFLSLNKQPKK
ncbi:glycosyl transferase family 2 [Methanobacterium lacus]|uniref:Glycosyl transferase family 2 n=1 Tax=Methanobacterium lacus (strain AL-21) TaxID=877455 RepID=F0TBM9_METLA|nr:glycosyltransferase family 2 protein [Methanobacterium lacus]ADZ09106.1 glycosyl transferase family 2 [Methanobacterium lacus]